MLTFTSFNGKPVAIAVGHVTSVRPSHEGGAYINFIGGFAKVRDRFETVVANIIASKVTGT